MTDADWAALLIRLSTAATMIAFGLHQIVTPLAWREYIPEWLHKLDPLPPSLTLQLHGVGNLLLGFLFAIGFWPEVFDWVVVAWWASISPLAYYVKWSIGMRDTIILAGLIAMILISH